jgi:hypothetical protein
VLKKISIRIALLAIILVGLNAVYARWFYEGDIQEHSAIINLVRQVPADADILYIGESSNTTYREDDLDKRPISAFLGAHFPGLKTYDITKPAGHAGIYKVLLEQVPEDNAVKTVVVTLNLRSFGAQWIHSDLETSLQKSLVLLRPYPPLVNRFLLSFKAYDIQSDREREAAFKRVWKREILKMPFEFPHENVMDWDAWMAKQGVKDRSGNYDQANTQLACHYIKTYGFQVRPESNPRFLQFDEIIALAAERNWNLAFNLMAENTEKAEHLVGEELTYLMRENARLLSDYFEAKGVTVINNIEALANDQFIDQHWTTEHYDEQGRKTLARQVAQGLRKWHGAQYESPGYKKGYQHQFFNDAEGVTPWGQMNTLSKEHAHSGQQSSATGGGGSFSITLEYPLKAIPDSLKQQVNVSLWYYATALGHGAELVLEAKGDSFDYYWQGSALDPSDGELNTWAKFEKQIPIPVHIRQADVIKIYVYNTSNKKVYVDDVSVVFGLK